jgi:hypothetical protein
LTNSAYADAFGADDVRKSVHATRLRLARIARLLDSAFTIPGTTVKVGIDPLLNLLPGLGQIISNGLSIYILVESYRLGAPPSLILRMVGNLALDFLISALPVAGWIGDIFFRANNRNVALLNDHLDRLHPPPVLRPDMRR